MARTDRSFSDIGKKGFLIFFFIISCSISVVSVLVLTAYNNMDGIIDKTNYNKNI